MDDSTIQKVWSWLGLAVLYLSLNFWSYTQQWRLKLPALVEFDPSATSGDGKPLTHAPAVYGIVLTAPLLVALLLLTRLYALRRQAEPAGVARLPAFLDLAADARTLEGWWFRAVVAFLVLLVPLAAQAHFWRKFLGGAAVSDELGRIEGLRHYLPDPGAWLDGSFRYDTIAYFPLLGPWLLLVLQLVVLWSAVQAARALLA